MAGDSLYPTLGKAQMLSASSPNMQVGSESPEPNCRVQTAMLEVKEWPRLTLQMVATQMLPRFRGSMASSFIPSSNQTPSV